MMPSPRRWFSLVILSIFITVRPALAQQAISVSSLIQHATQYDGKVVTVTGVVVAYRERVSGNGNAYTTFRVEENGSSVSVFAWKYQGLHEGERVRVIGAFKKVSHVGAYTFYDEIQAQKIEALQSNSSSGVGPTALCNDGTYSYAAHHQGACSHHGGVAVWYR
ncbi:MAG TPA: DUF3761 domain-containing protein [bacterium]|nr:DUF3761 domain-containing protein [bacterium]